MKELVEGAMSLYNTIELETNNTENKYTTGEDKIKEVLGNEEPLFIQEEDKVAGMLFQYLNLGYALCGVKYIDMLLNNKAVSTTAIGYALQTLNKNTEELLKSKEKCTGKINSEEQNPLDVYSSFQTPSWRNGSERICSSKIPVSNM